MEVDLGVSNISYTQMKASARGALEAMLGVKSDIEQLGFSLTAIQSQGEAIKADTGQTKPVVEDNNRLLKNQASTLATFTDMLRDMRMALEDLAEDVGERLANIDSKWDLRWTQLIRGALETVLAMQQAWEVRWLNTMFPFFREWYENSPISFLEGVMQGLADGLNDGIKEVGEAVDELATTSTATNLLRFICAVRDEDNPEAEGNAMVPVDSVEVPANMEGFLNFINGAVNFILDAICDLRNDSGGQAYAAVPEWWAARPGYQRPQLVLHFRAKGTDGKFIRNGRPNVITIPWAEESSTAYLDPPVGSHTRGYVLAEIELRDNSKVRIFCNSEEEAERVMAEALGTIPAIYKPDDLTPKLSKMRNRAAYGDKEVFPFRAIYLPTGAKDDPENPPSFFYYDR